MKIHDFGCKTHHLEKPAAQKPPPAAQKPPSAAQKPPSAAQ